MILALAVPSIHFDIYIQGLFAILLTCVNIAISAKVLSRISGVIDKQLIIMQQTQLAKHAAQQAVDWSMKTDNQVGEVRQQIDTSTASIISEAKAAGDSSQGVIPTVNIDAATVNVNSK